MARPRFRSSTNPDSWPGTTRFERISGLPTRLLGMTSAVAPFMRGCALAICLLAATACDENPVGPSVPLNQRFTLGAGEIAAIESTSLLVQFVRVSGDSRCPADAFCIQGGDAIVHIRATADGESADYELHTGDSSRARATHRGVRIELVELQPYPFSSRTIQPSEYRATLTASR